MKKHLPIIIVGVGVVAIVLVAVASTFLLKRGHEEYHAHEHGTDAHVIIDPVKDDPLVAAEATMYAIFSFKPAEQNTPFDHYGAVRNQLTGVLLEIADHPPTDEFAAKQFPAEWQDWSQSHDEIRAFVTRVADTKPIDEHAETALVTVNVRQVVVHDDGDQTPWRSFVADVEMQRIKDTWKAANFTIKSLGTESTSTR